MIGTNHTRSDAAPTGAFETLAARFRPGGMCLFSLRADGSLEYADTGAGAFYNRYARPALEGRLPGIDTARIVSSITAESGVTSVDVAPGVLATIFPVVERKQIQRVVGLMGKSSEFRLGEDVVRVCSQIGLDGIWLSQQADELPSYTTAAATRQTRLLLGMTRDQFRLDTLETELRTLSSELADTYEELSLIYQLSGGMKVNRGATDFFKQACVDVMNVMELRGIGVTLHADNLDTGGPALYGQVSLSASIVQQLSDALMRTLRRQPQLLLINDVADRPEWAFLGGQVRRLLAVPLQRQEQVLGCLYCIDKEEGDFDTVDAKLMSSIANESAIYLENAILFADVQGLMMGLLHSLTSAVDAKDPYTCGHSERVALISRMIARNAGLPDALCERIYMAGLLHDVGKIGVPEAVLQKAGKLDNDEFAMMKKHPEIGARILRDVKQIEDVIPGVLHHHERYDGKGYPTGLAGEQIPLMGRIICLADSFDAMTSSRTYRKALPLEVALTEIRRCAGTQFDPQLTDAFLEIGLEKLREIIQLAESRRLSPFANERSTLVA